MTATTTGPRLTTRQLEVLTRVAEGATYPQLAREWHVSENTVRGYGHRAIHALGATTITNAVLIACRAGLLDGRPQRHGDHAGYAAHLYRGEDPCEKCRAGERTYRAQRRAERAGRAA